MRQSRSTPQPISAAELAAAGGLRDAAASMSFQAPERCAPGDCSRPLARGGSRGTIPRQPRSGDRDDRIGTRRVRSLDRPLRGPAMDR